MGLFDSYGRSNTDYLIGAADACEVDVISFPTTPLGDTCEHCPLNDRKRLVLIPRKTSNIWDGEHFVKPLLPYRYPSPSPFRVIKDIELNFYPDLNLKRTVTAVVTTDLWCADFDQRPAPRCGVTVYFVLGPKTTAPVTLSAGQSTTDGEGCASVEVTVTKLDSTKVAIEASNKVEIIASLVPQSPPAPGNDSIILTIHRNEDIDQPLGIDERPQDFATTLRPVINLTTWIVQQKKQWVSSNGAVAVQQLLNQVSCRRHGTHNFLKPDGLFGDQAAAEAGRFLTDFSTAAGSDPIASYAACQFGVSVEEDAPAGRGVKSYVRAEYGSYAEGSVVDGHMLVGVAEWVRGTTSRVMDADGLLDIYTAAVWEFIEASRARAMEYINVVTNWFRHPQDNGPGWPALVSQGVAYGYGCARSVEQFQADLSVNFAAPGPAARWAQYRNDNFCRIGIHMDPSQPPTPPHPDTEGLIVGGTRYGRNNIVAVTLADRNTWPHLQAGDVHDLAAGVAVDWRVCHLQNTHTQQYTGIDCSGFCQRIATEAMFRADHCADLVGKRICPRLPEITYVNGWARKLATGTWSKHWRAFPVRAWRHHVIFRGDLIRRGGHIVIMDTNDRHLLRTSRNANDIQILHACGNTFVTAGAAAGGFTQTECPRRTIRSPLAQWSRGWRTWPSSAARQTSYARILLWG